MGVQPLVVQTLHYRKIFFGSQGGNFGSPLSLDFGFLVFSFILLYRHHILKFYNQKQILQRKAQPSKVKPHNKKIAKLQKKNLHDIGQKQSLEKLEQKKLGRKMFIAWWVLCYEKPQHYGITIINLKTIVRAFYYLQKSHDHVLLLCFKVMVW